MSKLDLAFFGACTLLILLGGIVTVGAKNPIRGAMGLLVTIAGIAGMYLLLSAELLAAVQIIVYAGAVVVLFLFVIMLLGPSATSPRDARSAVPRYFGAALLLVAALFAFNLLRGGGRMADVTRFAAAPPGLGTVDAFGKELFTTGAVPFEIAGILLLVAVIGAVAVARGKQVDPTLLPAPADARSAGEDAARAAPGKQPAPVAHAATSSDTKEAHS